MNLAFEMTQQLAWFLLLMIGTLLVLALCGVVADRMVKREMERRRQRMATWRKVP